MLEDQVAEENQGIETETIEGEAEAAAMIVVALAVAVVIVTGGNQDQDPALVTGDLEIDLTPGTEDPQEETEVALAEEDQNQAQKAEADHAKTEIKN